MAVLVTLRAAAQGCEPTLDTLAARCWALGSSGLEERGDRVIAAFDHAEAVAELATALDTVVERVDPVPVDHLGCWEPPPVRATIGRLTVTDRPGSSADAGPVVQVVAGRSFGAGSHPSTRLALELLQTLEPGPGPVLDVGTGSGVLAIGAWRLGWTSIEAIDIDPDAVAAATDNVARNAATGVSVRLASVADQRGSFPLVLANLLVGEHERLARSVRRCVAPGGRLVATGVLAGEQSERLIGAYAADSVAATATAGGWTGSILGFAR